MFVRRFSGSYLKPTEPQEGQAIAVRGVEEVSFGEAEGRVYGLLGPNGAGKTITISMIAGLLSVDAGQVLVTETDVATDPTRAKRNR